MATNLEELVWAKKEGFAKRQFTRRQLSAMGDDVNGSGHDGWHIVESVKIGRAHV